MSAPQKTPGERRREQAWRKKQIRWALNRELPANQAHHGNHWFRMQALTLVIAMEIMTEVQYAALVERIELESERGGLYPAGFYVQRLLKRIA